MDIHKGHGLAGILLQISAGYKLETAGHVHVLFVTTRIFELQNNGLTADQFQTSKVQLGRMFRPKAGDTIEVRTVC